MIDNLPEKSDKQKDQKKKLTPIQRAAIVLEANGHSQAQVAKAVGVSSGTVKGWHRKEHYMAELEQTSRDIDEALKPIVELVQLKLGATMLQAQEVLQEALSAETKDGRPNWNVRMPAVRILFESFKILDVRENHGSDNGENRPIGPVIITVNADTAAEITREQERKRAEAIDVTAEDVTVE